MMVLLRWTWVLEPVCLPSHRLDPQPSRLSREGPQGSPGPAAHTPQQHLGAVASALSCRRGRGGATDRRGRVALHGDAWKTRRAGVAWHCFTGLRASVSAGAVRPG